MLLKRYPPRHTVDGLVKLDKMPATLPWLMDG